MRASSLFLPWRARSGERTQPNTQRPSTNSGSSSYCGHTNLPLPSFLSWCHASVFSLPPLLMFNDCLLPARCDERHWTSTSHHLCLEIAYNLNLSMRSKCVRNKPQSWKSHQYHSPLLLSCLNLNSVLSTMLYHKEALLGSDHFCTWGILLSSFRFTTGICVTKIWCIVWIISGNAISKFWRWNSHKQCFNRHEMIPRKADLNYLEKSEWWLDGPQNYSTKMQGICVLVAYCWHLLQ